MPVNGRVAEWPGALIAPTLRGFESRPGLQRNYQKGTRLPPVFVGCPGGVAGLQNHATGVRVPLSPPNQSYRKPRPN